MAFESNIVTVIGNLTEDPELRFTPNGTPVLTIRVAQTRKYNTKDGQQREETLFINANVWREMAENVAESVRKGDRVIVIGSIKTRSYENQSGATVYVTEIEADEIAPSLRWAKARSEKSSGGGGGSAGGSTGGSTTPPPPSDDDVPF